MMSRVNGDTNDAHAFATFPAKQWPVAGENLFLRVIRYCREHGDGMPGPHEMSCEVRETPLRRTDFWWIILCQKAKCIIYNASQ